MRQSKLILSTLLIAVIAIVFSCKSGKDGTSAKTLYHDLVSRNNHFFNGRLLLKETLLQLETQHKDDYSEILSFEKIGTQDQRAGFSAQFDEVVKKASFNARVHEESFFIDDSYLLIGEVYSLKGQYSDAIPAFQKIASDYKDAFAEKWDKEHKKGDEPKKKKGSRKKIVKIGDEETPVVEPSFFYRLLHKRPARYKATVGLVHAYIESGLYNEAEAVLTIIKGDKFFPEKLRYKIWKEYAYFHIRQENYEQAIKPLEKAISIVGKKKTETRYQFILAQVFEQTDNTSKAIQAYRTVLELKPDFEMEFNAQMSIVRLAAKEKSISKDEVKALLAKMLKQDRNSDFYDQIYYALAEISITENNLSQAEKYFHKSIEASTINKDQKGLSYLRLGELKYDAELYPVAKLYYDSSLLNLSKSHEKFIPAEKRDKVLTDLVKNLNIIAEEDSLQDLANMDPDELNKFLANMLKEIEKQKEQDQMVQNNDIQNNDDKNPINPQGGGEFYFDNPSVKSNGYNDFIQTWGNIKKEDNWRRSNKSSIVENDGSDSLDGNEVVDGGIGETPKDIEALKKNIPLTTELMTASNNRIIKAMFNAGTIYKDGLENKPKAIEMFEALLSRFPSGYEYVVSTYYNLFLLYGETGNTVKADYYKNLILLKFPESQFAQIINDPLYFEKQKKKDDELNNFYSATYQLFLDHNYSEVIARKTQADELYRPNPLKPKFDLLAAMCIGGMGDVAGYVSALETIVKTYPNDEVKKKAEEILSFINPKKEDIKENSKPVFLPDDKAPHFFFIVFNDLNPKVDKLINAISDYNSESYSLDNLNVSSVLFTIERKLVLVQSFIDLEKSMSYYNSILDNNKLFKDFNEGEYEIFIGTSDNYNLFYQSKDVEGYAEFFNANYLKP